MSTIPPWWKATATAPGREALAVEFPHEGSDAALYLEAERLLLGKLKPGLVSSAPRGLGTPVVVDTLRGHGYSIASIVALDAERASR